MKNSREIHEKLKKDFIERSATTVSETVSKALKAEITALKEDIDTARKNDFGRKIFESFASEYGTSYLNEAKEIKKVQKQIVEMEAKLNESQQAIEEKEDAVKLT